MFILPLKESETKNWAIAMLRRVGEHFDILYSLAGSCNFYPLSPHIMRFANTLGFEIDPPNERTITTNDLLAIDGPTLMCYKAFALSRKYDSLLPPVDMSTLRLAVRHCIIMKCIDKLLEMNGENVDHPAMNDETPEAAEAESLTPTSIATFHAFDSRGEVCSNAIGEKVPRSDALAQLSADAAGQPAASACLRKRRASAALNGVEVVAAAAAPASAAAEENKDVDTTSSTRSWTASSSLPRPPKVAA